MKRILITSSLILAFITAPSFAADCQGAACIDVYTENGEIVIEGHKNPAPPPPPKPRSTVKALPRPKPVVTRAPSVPRPPKPRPVTPPVKVESLNDRLTRLLPNGEIAFAPATNPVVHIPVIFWSNLPGIFHTNVTVIGEAIDVTLRPSFLWSFGDGQFLITTDVGAPFPNKNITHVYEKPGVYTLTLVATWGGTWVRNGVSRAITGQIRKVSTRTIQITTAQSVFTG